MRLAEIETRFKQSAKIALREGTIRLYMNAFKRMWNCCGFEGYKKDKLMSVKTKQKILDFIHEKVPEPSRRPVLAGLEAVWVRGTGLPWPINTKLDIGRLPKVGRGPTPRDPAVKEWAEAMSREKDPFDRLIWLFPGQFGLRPSHGTGLRWSDIKVDENGEPLAIVAYGDGKRFKRDAPVFAYIPPDVAKALNELKAQTNPSEGDWIMPNRGMKGQLINKGRMCSQVYLHHWNRLMRKYKLPKVRPKDMRHWVDTVLINAQQGDFPLLENSRAKMMGHDFADIKPGMGALYYSDDWEPVIDNQRQVFPNGPLARFFASNVLLEDDIPLEIKVAWREYSAGRKGLMELLGTFESQRMKQMARRVPLAQNV